MNEWKSSACHLRFTVVSLILKRVNKVRSRTERRCSEACQRAGVAYMPVGLYTSRLTFRFVEVARVPSIKCYYFCLEMTHSGVLRGTFNVCIACDKSQVHISKQQPVIV